MVIRRAVDSVLSREPLVPNHDTAEHRIVPVLAEISTGNRGIDVTASGSICAARKTDMKLGIPAWGAGKVFFPSSVVEARVWCAISLQETALRVVVELNPQPVELDVLKKVCHGLPLIERALRSGSDDIVSSRHSNQSSQGIDHGRITFITGCNQVSL